MVMSWSNFEELKKFARKNGRVHKKRSTVGWQNPSVSKRRRTNSGSLSFVSNTESGDIEGFSTDEEQGDDRLDCDSDSVPRNQLSKPFVKRKCSNRQTLSDKRSSTSADSSRLVGNVQKGKEWQDCKRCDFPDGAYELLQYSEPPKEEAQIVWCASDDEELPQVFSDGSDSDDTETTLPANNPGLKSSEWNASAKGTSDSTSASGEVISDFQSDQESSQESLSADICTLTPTPVTCNPVVVGTPRTASEWLKQVQQKSPHKNEEGNSPDGRGAGITQCDSAKKKRKFLRCGLAERLQHIIAREKSEKAFWYHRVADTEKESAGASQKTDGSIAIQILCDQLQGALHFTQCHVVSKDSNSPRDPPQRLVFVLFTCETWKQLALQVGAIVNIHPPWQKLDIPGVPWPVLLCTYFCDKQAAHQSPELDLQSIKDCATAGGLIIPLVHTSPSTSTLVQSPQKGFKPSKLLFGSAEDTCVRQKKIASSSLTTVPPVTAASSKPRPHTSILSAIESCGGYSGALVTFQCLVQRVYRKRILLARDRKHRSSQLLNQDLKSTAKSLGEVEQEELRWTLLVQDIHGLCAEIQVPPQYQDSLDWRSCIQQGEGKVFSFSQVSVQQRTYRIRSPGLFSIIQSLWPVSDTTVTRHDGSSQIISQESGSQAINSSSPPNFCYVLTVQDSSQARPCPDQPDVCNAGMFYNPCAFRALLDVLREKADGPERFNVLCRLLYCRSSGSASVEKFHHPTVELFVTDSSLQTAAEFGGRTDELFRYVKIVVKSYHVLPEELRRTRNDCGTILSAKHLLLKANQELAADTYSVIRTIVPESTRIAHHTGCASDEEPVPQDAIESLSSLQPAALPCLTRGSCNGYIYHVEGVVVGVDEESACCWLACDTCGNADLTVKQEASPQFFCLSCDAAVNSPQTKTHLAVFVKVKSFPEARVKVTLQQSTVDKLLPVSYQDSDQGYDIEAVLDKQLEPMSCYVTEHCEQQLDSSSSFCLEEIHIH